MYEIFIICFFIFIVGACIGSFLNVVALRAMSGESIVLPSSKCPQCKTPIKWYDNIPIFSYFFTVRGKCRNCGCKISIQYPIVEALTAIILLALVIAFGFSLKTLILFVLLCIAIVLSITDIKEKSTYDIHLWIFIITSIIYGVFIRNGHIDIVNPLLGIIACVVLVELIGILAYFIIYSKKINDIRESDDTNNEKNEDLSIIQEAKKNKCSIGMGDIYIAAGIGAMLGWKYGLLACILGPLFHAICILPEFFITLFRQKCYKILVSLSLLFILALLYYCLLMFFDINIFLMYLFILLLIIDAVYIIICFRNTVIQSDLMPLPLGPALLISCFVVLFFSPIIVKFIKWWFL